MKMSVTRLFDAIRHQRYLEIQYLLMGGTVNINSRSKETGENCLIEALRIDDNRVRLITFNHLLRLGVEVHNRDKSGRDALEWALKLGREKEALRLLKGPMSEYDFTHHDSEGLTALHHATINNLHKAVDRIVAHLIKYRNSVDIRDSLGLTPYLHAKYLGRHAIADILRKNGASSTLADTTTNRTSDVWGQEGIRYRKAIEQSRWKSERSRLKLNGRLSEIKRRPIRYKDICRLQEETIEFSSTVSHRAVIDNSRQICEMLQLKDGSEQVKTRSTYGRKRVELGDDTTPSQATTRSSIPSTGPSQMEEIVNMLNIVSQNLSNAYCPSAKAPEVKVRRKTRVNNKFSSLAAIMAKKRSTNNGKARCKSLNSDTLAVPIRIK